MTEQTQTSPLYPADGSPTTLRGLPLLDAIIEHVELHPDTWLQRNWATRFECGTAYCIAGHAAAAAGYPMVFEPGAETTGFCVVNGAVRPVDEVAHELLGTIGTGLGEYLFSATNTLDRVKRVRDHLANRLDQPLRYAEVTPDA